MSRFRSGHTRAAKLTAVDVLTIRQRYDAGDSQGTLAREYKMSIGQIGRIVRNESWNTSAAKVVSTNAAEESLARYTATMAVPDELLNVVELSAEIKESLSRIPGLKKDRPLGPGELPEGVDAVSEYINRNKEK
jgi:hypothetical protein